MHTAAYANGRIATRAPTVAALDLGDGQRGHAAVGGCLLVRVVGQDGRGVGSFGQDRDKIRALTRQLPALWHAPTAIQIDRKDLLRTLIESITVTVLGAGEQVEAAITWAGGRTARGRAARPVAASHDSPSSPA